jgi:putative PIN family toxin of toxin-antitoxin system
VAPPRLVVDTNVLIAAVVSRGGTCDELFTGALAGRWTPIVSPILLEELADVFGRPKFRRSISFEQVEAFTADLALVTEVWPDSLELPGATGDPDDDFLVALAVSSGAAGIVSGDSHLTAPTNELPVAVFTPAQLLADLDAVTDP